MQPLISIIIAVRNGSNYLAETLESIKAQDVPAEIVVVSNGSADNTEEIAARYGAVIRSLPEPGVSHARNVGAAESRGERILFLDHDDILAPGALRMFSECMNEHNASVVLGQAKDFISPDLPADEQARIIPKPIPYFGLLGSVFFHRSALNVLGTFDENLKFGEAVDFLLRLKNIPCKQVRLNAVAVYRRLHASNTGRTSKQQEFTSYAGVLRARLMKGK